MHAPISELRRLNSYRAIRPGSDTLWDADYYSTADTDLRASNGQTRFTAGVISLVHSTRLVQVGTEGRRVLLSCYGVDTKGYRMGQVPAADGFEARYDAWVGVSSSQSTPVIGGEAKESANQGRLMMAAMVVDDDPYPDDGYFLNGVRQVPPTGGGWTPESTGQNLYLGRKTNVDLGTEDWFIGWFWHEDAMTEEELFILMQNIMLARRIPDTDIVGGGTVPDHIFDVASAMSVGSDAAPSTWTSIGATGGKTMAKTGLIDVVEIDPVGFGSRG